MFLKAMINNLRGLLGEKKVSKVLKKLGGKTINNLILKDKNNMTHQIDHVLIRKNGIFCVETKNYRGKIKGDDDNIWKIKIGNKKFEVKNPVKQNECHIWMLNSVLKNNYEIENVVVLVKNNNKKVKSNNVVNLKDLKKYIKNFKPANTLNNNEINNIYNILEENRVNISNRKHVKNIKKKYN